MKFNPYNTKTSSQFQQYSGRFNISCPLRGVLSSYNGQTQAKGYLGPGRTRQPDNNCHLCQDKQPGQKAAGTGTG